MTLQDIVDLAKHSEAAGTAIKDNTDVILLFLNSGMTELYKRFPLNTEELIVSLVEGTTEYALPTDYMYYMSAFEEVDINGTMGISEIAINDESDDKSIFFPNHKIVQIPGSEDGAFISIIYVSKPPSYNNSNLGDDIDLPDTLINCLLHYIGYKAHLGISANGQAETNAHFVRFERSCDKARELGVAHPVASLQTTSRLIDRGFV